MKRVRVINIKDGRAFGADLEDPTGWIAEQTKAGSWGKPERIVPADSEHDKADVLEDIPQVGTAPVVDKKTGAITTPESKDFVPARVRLKPEYTIEQSDVSAEFVSAKQTRNARRALGRLIANSSSTLTAAQQKAALKFLWEVIFSDSADEP